MSNGLARYLSPRSAGRLAALGRVEADAALKVITNRIQNGEPDKIGKPLSGRLSGCRRIRTGTTRIIYRVNARAIEVLIIAVGMRRNDEVYIAAQKSKIFSDERIDPLLSQVQSKDAESLLGETGLAGQLKKRLAERMLEAELNHPLAEQSAQGKTGNHRNGSSAKTV